MISKRCTNMNLLNHSRQKKTVENLNIRYTYFREKYGHEWMCTMAFTKNGIQHEYSAQDKKKKSALISILKKVNRDIFI